MSCTYISRLKSVPGRLPRRDCYRFRRAIPPRVGSRYFQSNLHPPEFDCSAYAEPIGRYQSGGYHPVRLGDVLKNERYKIVHKLGWGSFSTTWLALDQTLSCYVALKICISSSSERAQSEASILEAISKLPNYCPGRSRIVQMRDTFVLSGPNGNHTCIALEPLGPCTSLFFNEFGSQLPAFVIKAAARQTLQGIDFLSSHGIGHADLHLGNIAFSVPSLLDMAVDDVYNYYNEPVSVRITRKDGKPLGKHVPPYLVESARLDTTFVFEPWDLGQPSIKIIDLGQAFSAHHPITKISTALPMRAPEVILGNETDKRIDLWSAGCLLFALATGSSPFCGHFDTLSDVMTRMVHYCPDKMPPSWDAQWRDMPGWELPDEDFLCEDLQQWIKEEYKYPGSAENTLSEKDLLGIVESAVKLLRFDPARRASMKEVLKDEWISP